MITLTHHTYLRSKHDTSLYLILLNTPIILKYRYHGFFFDNSFIRVYQYQFDPNSFFFKYISLQNISEVHKTAPMIKPTSFPTKSSLFSTMPHGARPIATTLFLALVVLSLMASPTCLVTPKMGQSISYHREK